MNQKVEEVVLRVGDVLGVALEIHNRDGGTILVTLMGKSIDLGNPEREVLAEDEITGAGSETGRAVGCGLGHFDWHRNGIRKFLSSVCGRRGSRF